jgi:peptidoglycan/xylan/chitin deacetylase (PgdA/CDA1 family)
LNKNFWLRVSNCITDFGTNAAVNALLILIHRGEAMKHLNLIRTVFEIVLIFIIIILVVWNPGRPMSVSTSWHENIVHRVPTNEKVVALTYDDGPHPEYTPQILDILDKYQIKATFFMIGRQMERYPEIVKEVLRRGHTIGNHTYTHPRNIEADTAPQIIRELELCEQVIERMTGRRAYMFRPPRGLVDSTVFTIAKEEGYQTILWTVSADHHDAPTPELMAKRVSKLIKPGGIILAHDGTFSSRWKDVQATSLIIDALLKQGYRFIPLSELLAKGNQKYSVGNHMIHRVQVKKKKWSGYHGHI